MFFRLIFFIVYCLLDWLVRWWNISSSLCSSSERCHIVHLLAHASWEISGWNLISFFSNIFAKNLPELTDSMFISSIPATLFSRVSTDLSLPQGVATPWPPAPPCPDQGWEIFVVGTFHLNGKQIRVCRDHRPFRKLDTELHVHRIHYKHIGKWCFELFGTVR